MNDESLSLVNIALESARRLEQTLSSMLHFFESHSLGPRSKSNRIDDLALLIERARVRGRVVLAADIAPQYNEFTSRLDADELEMIFSEIFTNARRFHPTQTPRVELSLACDANGILTFVVQDDGVHLNTAELRRITQPFYQSERWHTGEVDGAGLGLNIISTLLWSAGGHLKLENRSDRAGLKVTLKLPATLNPVHTSCA